VVALWAAAGLVTVALSLARMVTTGWPGGTEVAFAAVFGALMAATWIWPITLYFDGESDAIDFDYSLIFLTPAKFLHSEIILAQFWLADG